MTETVRILLVEDSFADAELAEWEIRQTLPSSVFQRVDTRPDFLAALEAFQPDLIVSDYRMPQFDGSTALKLALEHAPLTPVIILTGAMNEDTAVACMKAGATDYVIKEHIKRLGTAVLHALEEKELRHKRKQAEKALRESEFFLKKSQSVARLGSYIFNARTGCWTSSPVLDEILGIDNNYPKDMEGWLSLIHPEYKEEMSRYLLQHVVAGRNRFDKEYRIIRQNDGQERWVHGLGELEFDESGNTIQMIGTIQDITRRRQTEETLQLTQFCVDHASIPIFLSGPDGEIRSVNNIACQSLGYTREELCNEFIYNIDPTFDREKWYQYRQDAQSRKAAFFETIHQRKDGTTFPVEISVTYLEFHGEVVGFSFARDISERNQAEEALRESEERYRQLFELESDAIFLIDNETGCIQEANGTAAELYGYGRQELLSMRNSDLSAEPEDTRRVTHTTSPASGQIVNIPLRWHRKKDGTIFPVEITGRFFLRQNRPVHIAAIRDITERIAAERSLRESEERFKRFSAVTMEGIFFHHQGVIIDANQPLAAMFGYQPDELPGRQLTEFIAPESHEFVIDNVRRGIDGPYEALGLRKNGSVFPVEVIARSYEFRGQAMRVVCIRDITERKLTEEAQAKLEEKLRQAQKLESIGRLAGGIAHDFNNLLVPLIGYAELGQMKLPPDSQVFAYLEKIRKAGEHAANLTRQILAFSRRQMLEIRVVNLNEIVTGFEEMLRRLIGEDIEIRIVVSSTPCVVEADQTQIEQILLNLSVNARDAMPDGGQLIIETDNVYLDESYTKTRSEVLPGHYVMLSLSDTGHGMDSETQKYIFEPFFTTKERSKGTGLGLATVFGIVKQHRGNIWVYSEPGGGATFKIYLPRTADDVQFPITAVSDLPSVYGEETVMVMEDDPMVRKLACETLESYGYTVMDVESPQQGLRLAREYEGAIHLLLTDVIIPTMNGRELYEKMVTIRPDLRVLYMSGYTDNVIVHHGVLDEGVEFLQKPFTVRGLAQKVRQVLDWQVAIT